MSCAGSKNSHCCFSSDLLHLVGGEEREGKPSGFPVDNMSVNIHYDPSSK